MANKLNVKIIKENPDIVNIQITRDNFEAFCNSIGLFKKEFIDAIDSSEKDHKAGRIKERKSLYEIIRK